MIYVISLLGRLLAVGLAHRTQSGSTVVPHRPDGVTDMPEPPDQPNQSCAEGTQQSVMTRETTAFPMTRVVFVHRTFKHVANSNIQRLARVVKFGCTEDSPCM